MSPAARIGRWLPLVACGVTCWLGGAAAAVGQTAAPPSATPRSAAAEPESPSDEDVQFLPIEEAQELEGEWLVEEETGQRYRIEKLPKVERAYKWVDPKRALFPLGVTFEIMAHDDRFFWVKAYETENLPKPPRRRKEAPAELSEPYPLEIEATDRLTFEAFDEGLPGRGQWRNGFDLADMNGDGHLDIVFGPPRKGMRLPHIFLGDGQGGWSLWQASFPELPYDYGDAEAVDLDGDGHQDLALAIHLTGMAALVGDGRGAFRRWSEGMGLAAPGGGRARVFSTRALASTDWDGDGRPDLIALGEGPQLARPTPGAGPSGKIDTSRGLLVYVNEGEGRWRAHRPQEQTPTTADFGNGLTLADLNADGRLDVITESHRLGSPWVVHLADGAGMTKTVELPGLRPKALISSTAVADLSGDGHDDLALGYRAAEGGSWWTGIDLFFPRVTDGALIWTRRGLFAEKDTKKGVTALDTGDLDADGILDVVALTGDGEVWVFLGGEGGTFRRELSPELPATVRGCHGWTVRAVDLDGQPGAEVVASFAGEAAGMPGVPGLNTPGCPGEGSIKAWRAVPRSLDSAESGP